MENNIRNISIASLLNSWGIEPEKRNEREGWYKAFDRSEDTASLKVDYLKNVYFDHGSGKGGGIVELVSLIRNCSVAEAFDILKCSDQFTFVPSLIERSINKLSVKNEIIRIKIIEHPKLIEYLQNRQIDIEIARLYCREIEYKVGNRKFYSIGFRNNKNGFELRNAISKTGTSPKAPTWIKSNKNHIAIFEGFFDFLSAVTIDPSMKEKVDFLILNSISFHQKIQQASLKKYVRILLFLDNDEAGIKARDYFKSKFENAEDRSQIYSNMKDINQWLMEFQIIGLDLTNIGKNYNI